MLNKEFKLKIDPVYFVPNIADRFNDSGRVHVIRYGKCNFRCSFCPFGLWPVDTYPSFTLSSFEEKIWELLPLSRNFKFTGGEPTLNPFLPELLKIIKVYNGNVFLDTNGSYPNKVKSLIELNLVDIVGISLKGLTPEDALETSEIKNRQLCWDNVWETIRLVAEKPNITLIITYVACEGEFKYDDLERITQLLDPFPNITLKINNCYLDNYISSSYKGLKKSKIHKMLLKFVNEYPTYKGRTVLFLDHDSCVDNNKIELF